MGSAGKWASRVEKSGSDRMGRWSWIDLRGKKNKMIRVISAYRVSQTNNTKVGELTLYKQQVRSLLKRGVKKPDPKQAFLCDLGKFIRKWREQEDNREIILMADMNEYTGDKGSLYDFCIDTDLIDTVALVNPEIEQDPTYIYGRKRIDYIFTSPALAAVAIKGSTCTLM